jgi:CDP-diacylglycerol--serine O-phosphatidyltransferase
MVSSRVRYPSFKDLKFSQRLPFRYLLLAVLALLFINFDPPRVLFGIVLAYVGSGPVLVLRHWLKLRRESRHQQ